MLRPPFFLAASRRFLYLGEWERQVVPPEAAKALQRLPSFLRHEQRRDLLVVSFFRALAIVSILSANGGDHHHELAHVPRIASLPSRLRGKLAHPRIQMI